MNNINMWHIYRHLRVVAFFGTEYLRKGRAVL